MPKKDPVKLLTRTTITEAGSIPPFNAGRDTYFALFAVSHDRRIWLHFDFYPVPIEDPDFETITPYSESIRLNSGEPEVIGKLDRTRPFVAVGIRWDAPNQPTDLELSWVSTQ